MNRKVALPPARTPQRATPITTKTSSRKAPPETGITRKGVVSKGETKSAAGGKRVTAVKKPQTVIPDDWRCKPLTYDYNEEGAGTFPGNLDLHLDIIAIICCYVGTEDLLTLRQTSKRTEWHINTFLKTSLRRLPVGSPELRLNIHYWFAVIRYFFLNAGKLKPIDRAKCKNVVTAFKNNQSVFPLSTDQCHSLVIVTLDRLQPEHILTANYSKPFPHTTSRSTKDMKSHKTEEVSVERFVKEYRARLTPSDDELLLMNDVTRNDENRLSFLFWEYLRSINQVIVRNQGSLSLRRVEYIFNGGHHITHRIWLQIEAEWFLQKNKGNPRDLHLTICDHFRWDT